MNMFVAILLAILYLGIGNVFAYMLTENGSLWVVVLWPLVFVLVVLVFIVEFTANFGKEIRKRVMKEDNKVGDKESK